MKPDTPAKPDPQGEFAKRWAEIDPLAVILVDRAGGVHPFASEACQNMARPGRGQRLAAKVDLKDMQSVSIAAHSGSDCVTICYVDGNGNKICETFCD